MTSKATAHARGTLASFTTLDVLFGMVIFYRSIGLALSGLLLTLSFSVAASNSDAKTLAVSSDTLSYTIQDQEPFYTNLPAELNGREIDTYRPIKVPSMSWAAGRAFYWKPESADGRHELQFVAESQSEPVDTLVLILDVQQD